VNIDPKTWWYVSRASGFVSWSLLAIAVLWGLFLTNKTLNRSTPPAWVLDLHRHLGGLAVVFVAVHVGALPLDGFTHWGWADLLVPMATKWQPGAIAWGIVGMYLLVAIEVTSLLGRRFPKKWWRRVHMLSFPLYILASIHLFTAGTDSGNVVARWMVVTVSTLILFLTVVRVLAAAKPRETRPNPRVAAARAQALSNTKATPAASTTTTDLLPSSSAPETPSPFAHPTPASADTAPQPDRIPVAARSGAPTLEARVARIHEQTAAAAQRARERRPREPVPAAVRAAVSPDAS